jgi:hypothetical protein
LVAGAGLIVSSPSTVEEFPSALFDPCSEAIFDILFRTIPPHFEIRQFREYELGVGLKTHLFNNSIKYKLNVGVRFVLPSEILLHSSFSAKVHMTVRNHVNK